jgi:hypothetical protein
MIDDFDGTTRIDWRDPRELAELIDCDDDDLCYCCGDEDGHDAATGSVFHLNEMVLMRARKERDQ